MKRTTPLPSPGKCPNDDQLKAFSSATLPRVTMDAIEDHVGHCEGCLSVLETCDEDSDALVQALAALPSRADDELAFQTLQETLLSDPHQFDMTDGPTAGFAKFIAAGDVDVPDRIGGYELLALIGRGATGAVFRARHLKLDRVVAIKVLNSRYVGDDPQAIERFQSEMKAVGRLDHPHIIRATDAGEDQKRHFLVMEYVDGIDASRLLRLAGPLRVADACEVVRQAALALQFAHEHKMVHRDVKPSNLLFAFDGQIKLLDLGLVRNNDQPAEVGHTNVENIPHGTADYMPPEQWTNFASVDARADIYSLGCTLYKLLAGTAVYPCTRRDYGAKMDAHDSAPIPMIRDRRPEVPLGLQKLICRMLAKRPRDRYDSAIEVAQRLDNYAQGARLQELGARIASTPPNEIASCLAESTASISDVGRRRLSRSRRWLLGAAVASIPIATLLWRLGLDNRPKLQTGRWRPLRPTQAPRVFPSSTPRSRTSEARTSGALASEATTNDVGQDFPVRFQAQADTLLSLGQPVQGQFAINARFTCLSRPQRLGIFFKYRPHKVEESVSHPFQVIELAPGDNGSWLLVWSHYCFMQQSDATYRCDYTPWAETPVDFVRASDETQLKVSLGHRGFPEVTCNEIRLGQAKWTLSWQARHVSQMTREERQHAFLGQLGIFGRAANATFSTIELSYLGSKEMT